MKKMLLAVMGLGMALGLSGCQDNTQSNTTAAQAASQQTYEWKLVTSWPKNFPGLGQAPETFAEYVNGRQINRKSVWCR